MIVNLLGSNAIRSLAQTFVLQLIVLVLASTQTEVTWKLIAVTLVVPVLTAVQTALGVGVKGRGKLV